MKDISSVFVLYGMFCLGYLVTVLLNVIWVILHLPHRICLIKTILAQVCSCPLYVDFHNFHL